MLTFILVVHNKVSGEHLNKHIWRLLNAITENEEEKRKVNFRILWNRYFLGYSITIKFFTKVS